MEDLTLVGVHDDGEHLLLTSPSGQRYRLRVDEAVRAGVRRDRARLSQIQVEVAGRMPPREIQTRIRAGESTEHVAESAGLSVEHVRRYEGPVLAERAFVAQRARAVRVRRGATSEPQTLAEIVRESLVARGVDAEDLDWDAWRVDDTTWAVVLRFEVDSRSSTARWAYEPGLGHLTPQDDQARLLVAEEQPAPAPVPQRRLAPVRDRVFDLDAAAARREEAAVDLLDTLRERRGRRNRPLTEEEEIDGAADPVREAIDSLLSRADLSRAELGPAPEPPMPRVAEQHEHEVLILPDADGGAAVEPAEVPARAQRSSAARRPRRASVPSWDDIVFGQRRD